MASEGHGQHALFAELDAQLDAEEYKAALETCWVISERLSANDKTGEPTAAALALAQSTLLKCLLVLEDWEGVVAAASDGFKRKRGGKAGSAVSASDAKIACALIPTQPAVAFPLAYALYRSGEHDAALANALGAVQGDAPVELRHVHAQTLYRLRQNSDAAGVYSSILASHDEAVNLEEVSELEVNYLAAVVSGEEYNRAVTFIQER